MAVFDPDPSLRWAFCMTHPDDEISICAWLRRVARSGAPVYVSWTHSNPTREREARNVAAMLGVPEENLRFFGATDGSVCDEMPALLPFFSDWLGKVRPDRVVCGAFEQGHLDHDATNLLVNRSFGGPVLEVPFYHTYTTRLQTMNRFADPRGEETLPLDPDERLLKLAVAKSYPSQNIWSVLVAYEAWQRARLRPPRLLRTERMRLQTHRHFLKPSLPVRLARRVERSAKWARWVRAVRALGP